MLRRLAEQVVRARLGVTVLVALLAALVIANEVSYLFSLQSLQRTTAHSLTRTQNADLMVSLLEAESAQRGVILTGGQARYVAGYRSAVADVNRRMADLTSSLRGVGPRGAEAASRLNEAVGQKVDEMNETVRLVETGRVEAALDMIRTGIGWEYQDTVRRNVEPTIESAHAMVAEAQADQRRYLLINRLAIHLLAVLGLVALYIYSRQIAHHDQRALEYQGALESEHLRLDAEVRRRTEALRELAHHLQTAQESERAHLARELHDELGGLFTAAKLEVARLKGKMAAVPDAKPGLQRLSEHLNEGIALKRRIIEDLRPSALTTLGLKTALELLCTETAERLDAQIRVEVADSVPTDPDVDLTLYRLVQEALTNISKYAKANSVQVAVRAEGQKVAVEVVDDGVGFDPAVQRLGSHGLDGMRFRIESLGGAMEVHSAPGAGTRLHATLPLQRERRHDDAAGAQSPAKAQRPT